jgi:apolipoprotein D and lipocalin family protein
VSLFSSYIQPLLALLCCLALNSCATRTTMPAKPPLQTVARVDLPRYMGDWRVIANIPYWAERDCVDSIETYWLRPDGKIGNSFQYRKKSFAAPQKKLTFVAEVFNATTNAEWRVKFLPFVKVPYLILEMDPDYQWTFVGHPGRKLGWIMARTPQIPEATYQAILAKLSRHGYAPEQFVKVPQPAVADAPRPPS